MGVDILINKSIILQYLLINSYLKLLDCVYTDKLENAQLIGNNVNYIKSLKPFMPSEVYNSFLNIIHECIDPITDDPEYFSRFESPELGEVNNEGIFEFKGEHEFSVFYARICKESIALQNRIQAWACETLSPFF